MDNQSVYSNSCVHKKQQLKINVFFRNTQCNSLKGAYDGTLFPQNISKNEEFRVYRKAFCRTLTIQFDHAGEKDGLEAYYFKLADNAFDSQVDDPNSNCFCIDNKCLKKGLGNITPCYYSKLRYFF